jgi:hypothetical protein
MKTPSLVDGDLDVKRRKLSETASSDSSVLDTHQLTKTSDYKRRVQFLRALALEPVDAQRRIGMIILTPQYLLLHDCMPTELDFIREVCEWDRQKRNGPTEGLTVPRLTMDPLGQLPPPPLVSEKSSTGTSFVSMRSSLTV